MHSYYVPHLLVHLLFSVGEQVLKLNVGRNPTDPPQGVLPRACTRTVASLNSLTKTMLHGCSLWTRAGGWGLPWRNMNFHCPQALLNHTALTSGQIILFFFSKLSTFQHVAVTGTPNDVEMVDGAPPLEPYSCDVVDEGGFLYCFLTSSINSSHTVTPFGECSFLLFLPFFLSSFLFIFPFFFLLLFRDTETLSRDFFVWCVALWVFLIACLF